MAQTEPPAMVPPVYALAELPLEERLSASELMDEIGELDFSFPT